MSEFAVYRTLGNGRCLVLDDTRIAGGKPDYRGNNYITSWLTNETYGPIDKLKAENAKLRDIASELYQQVVQDDAAWRDVRAWEDGFSCDCPHPIKSYDDSLGKRAVAPKFEQSLRELGIEVDG